MANSNRPDLTRLPVMLARVAVLVVTHLVKKSLGDDAVSVAAEGLAEYAGEELTEQIREFFAPKDQRRLIERAFIKADNCFVRACEDGGEDSELSQAIISLPLAGAVDLQARMPTKDELLDPSTISDLVRDTLSMYWENQLTDDQLDRATELYVRCLERSLASESTLILSMIYRGIDRLEANQELLIEGQRRIEELGVGGFSGLTAVLESINVGLSGLSEFVRQGAPSSEESEAQARLDSASSAKLDQCKSLYEAEQIRTALVLLHELHKEFKEKPPEIPIRFRLHTLMGGCHLQLGNIKEGIRHLEVAHELAPTNGIGMSNLAQARLAEGRIDEAINLANESLRSTDEETGARGILVQAEAANQHYDDLDQLIDPELFDDKSYLRGLGLAFYEAGIMDKVRKFLGMSLELDAEQPEVKLALASAIADQHVSVRRSRLLDHLVKPEGWQKDLSASLDLVSQVLDEIGGSQRNNLLSEALAMRGGLRAAVGETDEARDDCARALELDPANAGALHNLILLDMLGGDPQSVLESIEKLPERFRADPSIAFANIRSLLLIGQPEAALEEAQVLCKDGQILEEDQCLILKADALIRLGRREQAEALLEEYLASHEATPEVLDSAAFVYQSLGRSEDAIEALQESFRTATDPRERSLAALRLFDLALESGNEANAIEWLHESEVDPLADVDFTKRVINAHLNLRNLGEAETLARETRVNMGITDPKLISVEAYVSDRLGRLDQALSLEKQLVDLEPDKATHRLHTAQILYRLGQTEECGRTLDSIDTSLVADPQDLIQLSSLHLLFDRVRLALELAYRAWRRAPGDPDVHLAYAGIFLRVDDRIEGLDPSEVGLNSSVRLIPMDGPETLWITILHLEGEEPDPARWEFSPESYYGELLMGKSVGDPVDIVGGPLDKRNYTIDAVQSIFVRAFQETIQEFGARFPGHGGLQRMTLSAGDPTPFLSTIAGATGRQEAIYDAYRKGALTLEQFANLVGRNRLDIIGGLIGDDDKRIVASAGSHTAQRRQDRVAADARSIALDLSGLFTLRYLDLAQATSSRFDRILIPQQVIDELLAIREERRFALEKGMKSIDYKDGGFRFLEYDEETLRGMVEFIEEIITLARELGEIIGIDPGQSAILGHSGSRAIESGGKNSLSLIAVACSDAVPIYADDARLRAIAESQYKVKTFWTQSFLRDLLKRGDLSERDYALSCARLLQAGYAFTSVNRMIILETLAESSFLTTPTTVAVLSGLSGPDTNIDDAANIAAEAIEGVWSYGIPGTQRILMLDNILNALARGRLDSTLVVAKLKVALRNRGAARRPGFPQIERQIDLWHATRGLVS